MSAQLYVCAQISVHPELQVLCLLDAGEHCLNLKRLLLPLRMWLGLLQLVEWEMEADSVLTAWPLLVVVEAWGPTIFSPAHRVASLVFEYPLPT